MTEINNAAAGYPRLAAALIGGTALVEMVLVTHHPIAGMSNPGAAGGPFDGIQTVMQTNLVFHAILMLILVGQLLGLILFACRLRLDRPLVMTGLIFCGLAAVLLLFAMAFDGFVVFELVSRCRAAAEGCTAASGDALRQTLAIIQAFTKLGFAAQCLGFSGLGAAMWSWGGRFRIAAAICVAVAVAPFLILTSGTNIGPHQLMVILAAHAGWGLCVAAVLSVSSGFAHPSGHEHETA